MDMLCIWTLREQLRKFLTPNHVDEGKLEDVNYDGKMEFSKISGALDIRNWRDMVVRREEWQRLLWKARAHPGLSRQ
jgi:hypothetical protein